MHMYEQPRTTTYGQSDIYILHHSTRIVFVCLHIIHWHDGSNYICSYFRRKVTTFCKVETPEREKKLPWQSIYFRQFRIIQQILRRKVS